MEASAASMAEVQPDNDTSVAGPSTSRNAAPTPLMQAGTTETDYDDLQDILSLLTEDDLAGLSEYDDEVEVLLTKGPNFQNSAIRKEMDQYQTAPLDLSTNMTGKRDVMWSGQEAGQWREELSELQGKTTRRGRAARQNRNRLYRDIGREVSRARTWADVLRNNGTKMMDWTQKVSELVAKQQEKLHSALKVTNAQAKRIQALRVQATLSKPATEFKAPE
jgi:hypothetical protein